MNKFRVPWSYLPAHWMFLPPSFFHSTKESPSRTFYLVIVPFFKLCLLFLCWGILFFILVVTMVIIVPLNYFYHNLLWILVRYYFCHPDIVFIFLMSLWVSWFLNHMWFSNKTWTFSHYVLKLYPFPPISYLTFLALLQLTEEPCQMEAEVHIPHQILSSLLSEEENSTPYVLLLKTTLMGVSLLLLAVMKTLTLYQV